MTVISIVLVVLVVVDSLQNRKLDVSARRDSRDTSVASPRDERSVADYVVDRAEKQSRKDVRTALNMASTRLIVNRWIRNYAKAWRVKDAKTIASLFTEDGAYHSHPFRPVSQGRKSILEYTLGALDVVEVYEVRFGRPIVEGSRACVEYWSTMKEKVEDVTLAGCVMLTLRKERAMQGTA